MDMQREVMEQVNAAASSLSHIAEGARLFYPKHDISFLTRYSSVRKLAAQGDFRYELHGNSPAYLICPATSDVEENYQT